MRTTTCAPTSTVPVEQLLAHPATDPDVRKLTSGCVAVLRTQHAERSRREIRHGFLPRDLASHRGSRRQPIAEHADPAYECLRPVRGDRKHSYGAPRAGNTRLRLGTVLRMRTRLTDLLDIEHPIMLAGMGGVSYHRLVAAVSEAGGIGTLGASTMSREELPQEIAR